MSTIGSAQKSPIDIVRKLTDSIVDEAGSKAEDAAQIEFLHGKVKRLEETLSKTRLRLTKEFSHHARYNEQKNETWKYMRELGKGSDKEIDEVKAQVRARANPEAKAFHESEEAAEKVRVEEEKEFEQNYRNKRSELRTKARKACAEEISNLGKRKANGVTDSAVDSDGEESNKDESDDEKPRKKVAKESDSGDKKAAEAAKKAEAARAAAELAEIKARAASKAADAAESRASKAVDAEPHPGTLGIKAPAVSRPKGGKAAATHRGPKAPAPTIKKPAAAAAIGKKPAAVAAAGKKPAAAAAAGAAKPPKGQRKPKNAYQCWMGALTTKQRYNEERQKAIDDLKDDEELPDRFKSQREWYPGAWKQVSSAEHARFKAEAEEEKKKFETAGGAPAAAATTSRPKGGKKAKPAQEPEPEPEGSGSDSDGSDAEPLDPNERKASEEAGEEGADDDENENEEGAEGANDADPDGEGKDDEDGDSDAEGEEGAGVGAEPASDDDDDALSASK